MYSFETASAENRMLKHFFEEVVQGLTAIPKYLPSKYLYDPRGDSIFRHIMHSEEYYLSHCELEILADKAEEIVEKAAGSEEEIDVIELGPGDGSKSIYLLEKLHEMKVIGRYIPVDISANIIALLHAGLAGKLPELKIEGLNGEYFDMLDKLKRSSDKMKLVLFLGANIGNYAPAAAVHFCQNMRQYLNFGDKMLIGIDLKKHPQTILNAYNDRKGLTRSFNLNLLHRMNVELNAGFKIDQFDHYPMYDPGSGACKSYLVSRCDQTVHLGNQEIRFEENETVFMEISQKYTVQETSLLAARSGFTPLAKFFDSKKWFVDCLWDCQ